MTKFLFIFFLIIGIAGLIFRVDAGVFVGAALVPWELIKLNVNNKLTVTVLALSTIAGATYFILMGVWHLLGLLLLIEIYNIWGLYKLEKFIQNS